MSHPTDTPKPLLAVFTIAEVCAALKACYPSRWPTEEHLRVRMNHSEGTLSVREWEREGS